MQRLLLLLLVSLLLDTGLSAQKLTKKWTPLLTKDGKYFDSFIGIPHTSLTSLPGWNKGDGMNIGTPLGLNNDPLHVFTIEMQDGKPVLHISGEIYGGYSTKTEFEDYHLRAQVKFGENTYAPRKGAKRDNGILYHGQMPHGQFWHVWLRSQEFQVQEGDMGDFFALAGTSMDIRAKKRDTTARSRWIYDPAAGIHTFASSGTSANNVAHLAGDFENPHGEWTTLDLYCFGDKAIHVVNGHVVMVLENSRTAETGGGSKPLTRGKIQFQSEGAEAYYRNIEIRKIDKLPDLSEFKK